MQVLARYLKKFNPIIFLLLSLCSYIFITTTALFDQNHFLYNLEPYPDGILYIGSAQNFVVGNGLQLEYNNYIIPLWVPPLYPLYLSLFFFINQAVSMFYIANVILGVVSTFLIYKVVRSITDKQWLGALASALYITHGYILWLPSVPMTENISLMFFLLALYTLFSKNTKYSLPLCMFATLGLIFTRYSVLPTAIVIIFIFLHQNYWKEKDREKIKLILGATSICILLILLARFEQITELVTNIIKGSTFYNFNFISNNILQYTRSLLGFKTPFLWFNYPFSSSFLTLSTLIYSLHTLKNSTLLVQKEVVIKLGLLFFSSYPLLLIFYTVDTRYSIFSIPLLVIMVCLTTQFLYNKKKLYGAVYIVSCFLTVVLSQFNFYTYLLTANILGRTTAWQYESIKHIDSYFKDNNLNEGILITALPPFLVDSYRKDFIPVLPLSHAQEFLQKKQYVWGETINYDNLLLEYQERISNGEKIFITNAYITHQQQVIEDFEVIKDTFNLQLVSTGCLDACNIYQLENKQ